MFDELTAVNDNVLRHEVQFSSGTTLLVDFELIDVQSVSVHGRDALPLLEGENESKD
jgi:hypothetical protein